MNGNLEFQSDIQVKHPGIYLKIALEKLDMTQSELAIRTGVTAKHISTIINGEKSISASFAKKLEYALGIDSSYWIERQAAFDNYQVELGEENHISDDEIDVLASLKEITSYFVKRGFMQNNCGKSQKVLRLRKLLCVSDLTAIPKITYNAAYRAQVNTNAKIDPYVLFAWQKLCEKETENISVNGELNTELLRSKLNTIKNLMFEKIDVWTEKLQEIFAECGVAFAIVHNFKGAPVQGFIKKSENGKNILCMTIRNGRADSFWFTLFHEIGHLLNGDLSTRFVDFSSVVSDAEAKADEFAMNSLIPVEQYLKFTRFCDYHNECEIHTFAQSVNVPDFVVIGRLQKDELIDWSHFTKSIPRYKWCDD